MSSRSILRAMLAPIQRRVMLTVSRAIVRLVQDTPAVQELQLSMLRGELRSGVERLQEYGFTSHPLPGAWGLAVCVGGNRDHPVVVATDDGRYRPTDLAPGEVALYTDQGQRVHLKASGNVLIETPEGASVRVVSPIGVQLEAPLVTTSGNLHVEGTITSDGLVTASAGVAAVGNVTATVAVSDAGGTLGALRGAHNFHDHNENDNAPAPTAGPNTLA